MILAGLVLFAAGPAHAERVWLVVAASASSPASIARQARTLAGSTRQALVVQTSDCGRPARMFVLAEIAASRGAALRALARVRARVRDAYVVTCDVTPGSLLHVRMPAVDPSIGAVPADAVNWHDRDRISTAHPLSAERTLVVARIYVPAADDPLEGRRERVLLVDRLGGRVVLEEHCIDPGHPVTRQARLAFHCVRAPAGDHLLHAVMVFDETGRRLAEIERCRNPAWADTDVIACEAEAVDAQGLLTLTPRTVRLGSAEHR